VVDGSPAAILVVEPVGIPNERLSVGGRSVSGWNGIAGYVREGSVSMEVDRPLSCRCTRFRQAGCCEEGRALIEGHPHGFRVVRDTSNYPLQNTIIANKPSDERAGKERGAKIHVTLVLFASVAGAMI